MHEPLDGSKGAHTGRSPNLPVGVLPARDRDRGTSRDATPPTPPGIRVRTNGGSTELGLGGRIDSGKTERLEIVVA